MVQTVGRCHVPLLKNAKTFAFWGEYDKGITVYCSIFSFTLIKI